MSHTLQHAHEVMWPWLQTVQEVSALALVVLIPYMMIAMFFGCPYCLYPDLAWPKTLVEAIFFRSRSRGDS